MASVSAAMVKELRERTGLGMMECKKALVAAEGSIEQAIEDLRKNSGLKAAKKADRTAAEGKLRILVNGGTAVIVEVNSETDFVKLLFRRSVRISLFVVLPFLKAKLQVPTFIQMAKSVVLL